MFQLRSCILAAITLFGSAAVARADTIFTDFGAGDSYQNNTGVFPGPGTPFAFNFTSSQNYSLSQIDVALNSEAGTGSVTVSLWTESSGGLGTEKGSWTISNMVEY
ncbi:MAG: hypothetical protein ACREHV_17890, partial [Rhizomicrobium sp.]